MNPMPVSTAAALVAAVGSPTLARVQEDVAALGHLLSDEVIQREYLDPILRGEEGAVPELFSVARLARGATEIEPHAPGHRRRVCDARVQSGSQSIYVEVKHQRDNFPFNDPGVEVAPGITTHTGTRPGADPRYMGGPPPHTTDPLPSATIWRETLEEAAAQLPRSDPGLILVSCEAFGGLDEDTNAALFGDPVIVARPHPRGWGSVTEERLLGNGFFSDSRFSHVAGVWFFRLRVDGSDQPQVRRRDWARGHLNPNYSGSSLPDELTYSIPNVIGTED